MFSALKEALFGGAKTSKSLAKSRLHFVLVQDRTGLTGDEMANFKRELISVIERYFVIDERGFDINYQRENELTTLLINSPVLVRRQDSVGHDVGARKFKKKRRRRDRMHFNSAPVPEPGGS